MATVDRSELLRVLCECQPCTFEDLLGKLGWQGDLRPLRRMLAEMVREGVLKKEPDYERRKLVYRVSSEACGSLP